MARKGHGNGRSKPGPKPDAEKMALALHLYALGHPWASVAKQAGVSVRTLYRWQLRDDWREVCDKFDPGHIKQLERDSFAVLARALAVQLRKQNPDISIAERVMKVIRPPADDGEYPGGGILPGGGVIVLPMQNKGLESRPVTQVLMPPPKPPSAPPGEQPHERKPRTRAKPGRPRAAGPDE